MYPHVPSLCICDDFQNLDYYERGINLVCDCHVLFKMQHEEAKNSKFQPSEKLDSERIDIESDKKSTLPPSKSCVPKMSWLSRLGALVSSCLIIYFFGRLAIYNMYSTKTSVDDFGSKYLIRYCFFMSLTHHSLFLSNKNELLSFFFHFKLYAFTNYYCQFPYFGLVKKIACTS